ncbi:unnamed protein product [Prorocentrum cordatum]|uniref:C2 domain-containing protein n=1 Tax=Prorocentrum cordatum TaxID=2364126 RepID=A0ABN9X3M8_9DINO|nr:unnamed protein product [Polarella glacialis]
MPGATSGKSHSHVRPHMPHLPHPHMPHLLHKQGVERLQDTLLAKRSDGSNHGRKNAAFSPEALKLRGDLSNKLPFHDHRRMCITESDSAALCLGPSARLELTIVRARDLIPNETTVIDRVWHDPHPFVRVYLDDTRQCETSHVRNSRNPEWNSHCEVDVTAGRSMIRFQVYDQDVEDVEAGDVLKGDLGSLSVADKKSHSLGFVEVCVGDMPFDEEIYGWLELRFPNNLRGTNLTRYEQHCKRRDEDVHREMAESMPEGPSPGTVDPRALEQVSAKVHGHDSVVRRSARALRKLKCRVTGHESASGTFDDQFNAGELLVRMRLTRVGDDPYDDLFAHAIQPQALSFNPVIREEALPELDVQEAFDDAMDIKYAVLDDFVFSFASYAWYVLSWQSRLLSGIISLCFLTCCWREDLLYACFHAVLAALLVLNCFERQRREMTTSGLNAPLNDEGFRAVANWRSVLQMEAFLVRVVVARGGQIELERELRDFVTMGFRRGIPSATLEDVVAVLKSMDWVTFHGRDKDEIRIREGSRVRIHERRRATVDQVLPPEACTGRRQVVVHYDEADDEEQLQTETLYEDEVHVRTAIPKIPNVLLSGKVKQEIRKVGWQIDSCKRSSVLPVLRWISEVLTWQAPMSTCILMAYLLFRVVLATLHFVNPHLCVVGMTVWFMRNLGHIGLATAVIASAVFLARPLQCLFPLARMLITWPASRTQDGEVGTHHLGGHVQNRR